MRVLDLFSGIGGFSLGLERAGMTTVAFCEIDKFCQKVLKKHWPDVPVYNDIRKIRDEFTGTVDLICGGYPCQPFSNAGQRKGADDDRHLWPEMFACIQEYRPRWVIGENVAGHVSMGLDDVLSDMESAGYTCRPFIIPACAVDAPHRRDRIWLVAYSECEGPQGHARHGDGGHKPGRDNKKEGGPACPCGLCRDVSNAHPNQQHRRGRPVQMGRRGIPQEIKEDSVRQGNNWCPEPAVGRVAYGIPRRVDRLKGLGNAVVPQIPEIIGRAIMEIEKEPKNDR